MIYIENTDDLQRLRVPVSYKDPLLDGQRYKFLLWNTVNLTKTLEEILKTADFNNDFNADFASLTEPVMSAGGRFYMFNIELPADAVDGTYEYALMGGNKVLSRGVAIVGDFKNQDMQYEKSIEYEQYTGE